MVRVITALVTTLAAVVTFGAASTPTADPGKAPSTVIEAGSNQWCC
jgi:hypothetical protein